ncbi:ABC transporter permease [Flavitalea sp. BT771]|uniref:ABC transporter permease n=1 Tax=Flavitalea sp. BT771 TaxID=3063329 RepID=UPI0026E43514|nr:ABC transporter permease [Flavitalea sp. BT771]MDO6429017.1 ABC transporter permease [Flavitalea sp. BT771]MDV6218855.1 FtsX-like permease family protein [Flavitalea sp. BT771]
MLKNYLKIAFRQLSRNKLFSSINIFGLAAGLAVCLLIMLYILDELSYDKHHKDADRTYRLAYVTGTGDDWSAEPAPVAFTIKAEMPEVQEATRLLKFPDMDKVLLQNERPRDPKKFFESNGYYVDSTFFQLFTYDFTYGNGETALARPNSLVLSESIAARLFGNENPIGKPLKLSLPFGDFIYTVQAVFKENHHSHIPAHFFLSMRNSDLGAWTEKQTSWATNNIFHTYIKLKPGTDAHAFEKRMAAFMDRHEGPELKKAGMTKGHFMQHMTDIYLHSSIGDEIAPNGNIRYLYILGSIAAFILVIACINFMNLSTARSEKRAREVGVRKVIGAGRASLIHQFLGESFLLCLIALAIGLLLTQLLLPLFNQLTQKQLTLSNNPHLILWIAGLSLLTGLLSGLYPAFYLSSFRPAKVLKGKILNSWSATALRKGLVVFQFTISVMLILGAIVIGSQLHYLKNQSLGFKKDQQLILPITSKNVAKNYNSLKSEILRTAGVGSVTSGSTYPGIRNINDALFYAEGRSAANNVDIAIASIEDDYFETLGLQLIEGRPFARNSMADSNHIILNQTAARQLGLDPAAAVGKRVTYEFHGVYYNMEVTGVIRDFNFESLHNPIRPLGFSINNFFANKYNYTIVGLQTTNYSRALAAIEQAWTRVNPGAPFEYSFLDQDFQRNYEKEERTSHIVIYCTSIAILIACLGLFGLTAFSAERRTKEIGIRKVLGASVANVTLLLSGEFIRLALLAVLIASPLAWYGMDRWLRNFTYRITLTWWMFAAAGGVAIVIALVTVSFQSIRSALANPTKSLRAE